MASRSSGWRLPPAHPPDPRPLERHRASGGRRLRLRGPPAPPAAPPADRPAPGPPLSPRGAPGVHAPGRRATHRGRMRARERPAGRRRRGPRHHAETGRRLAGRHVVLATTGGTGMKERPATTLDSRAVPRRTGFQNGQRAGAAAQRSRDDDGRREAPGVRDSRAVAGARSGDPRPAVPVRRRPLDLGAAGRQRRAGRGPGDGGAAGMRRGNRLDGGDGRTDRRVLPNARLLRRG